MADVFQKALDWRELRVARATGLYPYFKPIAQTDGTEVELGGRRVIMVGTNNYLGLTLDPRVREAAIRATEKYGTSCSGSRLLNGTLDLHLELEERLARFLRRPRAVCFSTGFTTNLGVLSALLDRKDHVFSDRLNHASIVEGIRASFGVHRRYRHNDLADLERLLRAAPAAAGRLIVTDGVFSMEGDLAELRGISALKREHGARLMVDEAHGLGVMGEQGRGVCEHLGVEEDVELVMGTFSKSLASLGGVIAGPAEVIEWIQHKARAMIFQAAMTPAAVAAALAALQIVEAEPERRRRLWRIATRMRTGLRRLGFDVGTSDSAVVPVFVGDPVRCFRIWKALYEDGVFVNPVIPPAVEPGHALLRTSYMATHTDEQLDRVLERFSVIGRKLGALPGDAPRPEDVLPTLGSVDDPRGDVGGFGDHARAPAPGSEIRARSPAELAQRLFDWVEETTWRAATFELPEREELDRRARAQLSRVRDAVLERGYRLLERERPASGDDASSDEAPEAREERA